MYENILKLQEFYSTTRGKLVVRAIRKRISSMWKKANKDVVVGFGFANPYIAYFSNQDVEHLVSLVPQQYLTAVDINKINKSPATVICNSNLWPIESNSVNRVVIVHALNSDNNLAEIMREAWRVLVAEGRLMIIVSNRSGIWARIDNNPFGHGTPYSMSQIRDVLKNHKFIPEREDRALFFPPTDNSRFILSTASIWENIGRAFFNALGGVNIIEARKQVYMGKAVRKVGTKMSRRGAFLPSGSISSNSTHIGMKN